MDARAIGIETLCDFRQIAAVEAFWDTEQDHANNDRGQFELVCGLRPEVVGPCVMVATIAGQTSSLIVGRKERTRFAPAIGYLKPFSIDATVLVVIHRGALGRIDDAVAARTVDAFASLLAAGYADAVEFHHLSEDSPLLSALSGTGRQLLRRRVPGWNTHRTMTLPGSGRFMDQRVDAKHRSHFRKRQRCLDADFPNRSAWRWITHCADVDALCEALESVAKGTYQRGLGVGFIDGPEVRQRLSLFARRGDLRVQLLVIDGTARAFWLGIVCKGVFHSSETGYDPALRRYEVGSLMFLRMADALIEEGVQAVDFGLGDALYKERFGDRAWRETSAWMFAPTAKGVTMRVLLEATLVVDRGARAIATRLGVTDRVKRFWRRAVTSSSSADRGAKGPRGIDPTGGTT